MLALLVFVLTLAVVLVVPLVPVVGYARHMVVAAAVALLVTGLYVASTVGSDDQ